MGNLSLLLEMVWVLVILRFGHFHHIGCHHTKHVVNLLITKVHAKLLLVVLFHQIFVVLHVIDLRLKLVIV